MRPGLIAAAAGLAVMVAAITHALTRGDFSIEAALLLSLPWGRGTLIDLYVGLVIFSVWVALREGTFARSAPWIAAILCLGNFGTCLYLVMTLPPRGGTDSRERGR